MYLLIHLYLLHTVTGRSEDPSFSALKTPKNIASTTQWEEYSSSESDKNCYHTSTAHLLHLHFICCPIIPRPAPFYDPSCLSAPPPFYQIQEAAGASEHQKVFFTILCLHQNHLKPPKAPKPPNLSTTRWGKLSFGASDETERNLRTVKIRRSLLMGKEHF